MFVYAHMCTPTYIRSCQPTYLPTCIHVYAYMHITVIDSHSPTHPWPLEARPETRSPLSSLLLRSGGCGVPRARFQEVAYEPLVWSIAGSEVIVGRCSAYGFSWCHNRLVWIPDQRPIFRDHGAMLDLVAEKPATRCFEASRWPKSLGYFQ